MNELGQRAGTTASQINKLEKGQVKLTVEWMTRLAAALGCRPVELLDAPAAPEHINTDLLRSAIYVGVEVLNGDSRPDKSRIMVDVIAATYDVLVETIREGGTIDENTLQTIIRTNRRALLGRSGPRLMATSKSRVDFKGAVLRCGRA